MLADRLGEIAALGTSILWSVTYVQFSLAVREIGPSRLNRLRLSIALLFLMIAHTVAFGSPIPLGAEAVRWGWLILSGVIGFAISDAFLFRSLLHLGPHRTSLIMALIPVVSALLAWMVFGERLTWIQMLGALITVCGIVLVISARRGNEDDRCARVGGVPTGILFALGAVVAQSTRYLLSKQGMSGGFPVLSTNTIQILSATVAIWLIPIITGAWRLTLAPPFGRRAQWTTLGGAVTGPFLGVTLSLVALANAPVGIASTLMALTPVFLLPLSRLLFRESIGPRSIAGTLLAVGGVAVLFLAG